MSFNMKIFEATEIIIDTLLSEGWIIDSLEILKSYKNGYLYTSGIKDAYYCTIYYLASNQNENLLKNNIHEIIIASVIKDIGELITNDSDEKLLYTLDYLDNRTTNINIISLVQNYIIKYDDETSVLESELSFDEKLLFTCVSISHKCIEKKYANKVIQKEIDDIFNDLLFQLNSLSKMLTNKEPIYEERKCDYKLPVQVILDSIFDNSWILDLFEIIKNVNNTFLYSHLINTAKYAVFLEQCDHSSENNQKSDYSEIIVLGALLHDVGYIREKEIDHRFHLNFEMNRIYKELNIFHIEYGVSLITNILEREHYKHIDEIKRIINYHHEYLDGTGYYGITKDELTYPEQIIALANAIDLALYKLKDEIKSEDVKNEFLQNIVSNSLINNKFRTSSLLEAINQIASSIYYEIK